MSLGLRKKFTRQKGDQMVWRIRDDPRPHIEHKDGKDEYGAFFLRTPMISFRGINLKFKRAGSRENDGQGYPVMEQLD